MTKMKRYGLVFILGLMLLASCGIHIQHAPSQLVVDSAKIPPFRVVGPVKLVNAQTLSQDVVIPLYFTHDVSANYKQYTDAAINSLKLELEKKGAMISGIDGKTLKLAIADIKVLDRPQYLCLINYTVETGDGYLRGYRVQDTDRDFRAAIDSALAKVVAGVLQDEQVLNYLEK